MSSRDVCAQCEDNYVAQDDARCGICRPCQQLNEEEEITPANAPFLCGFASEKEDHTCPACGYDWGRKVQSPEERA